MKTAKEVQLEALATATAEALQVHVPNSLSKVPYYSNLLRVRLHELLLASDDASEARTVVRKTEALVATITPLNEKLYDLHRDQRFLADYIRDKHLELVEAWKPKALGLRDEIVAVGEAAKERVENATIAPPSNDPGVLEAMLGNARGDARMYLDLTDANRLPLRMKELVEHDTDPVITYLLLATRWAEHYLRSRAISQSGDTKAVQVQRVTGLGEWDAYRSELLPLHMTEKAAVAYKRDIGLAKYTPQVALVLGRVISAVVMGDHASFAVARR